MEHVYHVVGQIWPLPGLTPPTDRMEKESREESISIHDGRTTEAKAKGPIYAQYWSTALYYGNDAYLLFFLELMYGLTGGGNTSTVGAKVMSLSPVYGKSACSDCGRLVKALFRATALPPRP